MAVTSEVADRGGDLHDHEDTARYVYAVVPADTTMPAELTGVDDQPVTLVRHGAVAAVAGEVGAYRALGNRADLLAHRRVVDAMAECGAVVPVRFGSALPDSDAVVAELLAPNEHDFAGFLRHLTGRRQFTVRASYDDEVVLAEVVSENPDIATLRDRTRGLPESEGWNERVRLGELVAKAIEAKRDAEATAILDRLTPGAVDWHWSAPSGPYDLTRAMFLVDEDRRAEFEAAAEHVAEEFHGRARVQLLGPSAPYDFVPEA